MLVRAIVLMSFLLCGTASADSLSDCFQARDLDLNIRACTDLINRNQRTASAYFSRGVAYLQKNQMSAAIADLTNAVNLEQRSDHYLFRGIAYNLIGDYDRAIADYDVAVRLEPSNSVAYSSRGMTYERKGDRNKAIADYRTALTYKPTNSDALEGLRRLGVSP